MEKAKYYSTKTYGHDLGLSACFRQWKASSHCSKLHGYPLSFKFTFGADVLDANNWVMDFGGLKPVKEWLVEMFDHKLLVAADDPEINVLGKLGLINIADIRIVPNTGCEAFAELAFNYVTTWLQQGYHYPRVKLCEVEVREHGGNSAIYRSE